MKLQAWSESSSKGVAAIQKKYLSFASRFLPPCVEFDGKKVRDSAELRKAAGASLCASGAIVLRRYYSRDDLQPLTERVLQFSEQVEELRNIDPLTLPHDDFVIQNTIRRGLGGYGGYVQQNKPVVNFRAGTDDGLVDIFHPERMNQFQDAGVMLDDPVKEKLISELIEIALSRRLSTTVRNLYLNDSIRETRGFHVDGFKVKAKDFLYLTDVESTEDGPYCYALGTHLASKLLKGTNRAYNKVLEKRWDDFPIFDPRRRFTFLGRRGDVILSLQYGAHRGLPQKWGKKRLVLVHTSA